MTIIIVCILIIACLLTATENVTNVNKAAVAIFAGTLAWVLYVCATDQVVASNVFLKYVGRSAEIVMFLLATMTIVEILNNNGCFDFIAQLLKTRNSKKMLWTLSVVTFILSANLDNLSTTVLMLAIMHNVIQTRRQRMIFGSVIVIAANCGGALTVIGEPAGLVLWNLENVTATMYSAKLILPCIVAWSLPTWLIGRMLPDRCDTGWITMPYRGDDTRLSVWQRLLMLFVGIGGLWFIPTFHNLTQLSPFLGALCVLAVLWIVDELCNNRLRATGLMVGKRVPTALQYQVIQMILYVMGFMLALGAVIESGAIQWFINDSHLWISDTWLMGIISASVSIVLENFATAITFFSISPTREVDEIFWSVIAYMSAIGGNVLCVGSMSGLALMKMENVHILWHLRNIGIKALGGLLAGYVVMYFLNFITS